MTPEAYICILPQSSPKDMAIDFRERGRERERNKRIDVREKHWSVASCTHPDQELNLLPPRYVS